MGLLDRLERKFRSFAIPNLTLFLVAGQGLFFLFRYSGSFDISRAVLVPELVLRGEWWRLLAFLFIPPPMNLFFLFFALYLFYLMGTALENHWGAFRYNLFILTGYVLTVAVSFLFPWAPATNTFIGGSVFLAFALLFPDFQLMLFFILPVKIKWLALITWIGYGWALLAGTWQTRLLVLASIGNVLLFFGSDLLWKIRSGGRRMAGRTRTFTAGREPFHRCAVCGMTDVSHPDAEFRYCPGCGGLGYCQDHINDHTHRRGN